MRPDSSPGALTLSGVSWAGVDQVVALGGTDLVEQDDRIAGAGDLGIAAARHSHRGYARSETGDSSAPNHWPAATPS